MPLSKKVICVERQGRCGVTYELEDGSGGAFECHPSFAAYVVGTWQKRQAAGYTIASTPKGKETVIYVVPTSDGITLRVEPKMPLKIMHVEHDHKPGSMVQVVVADR